MYQIGKYQIKLDYSGNETIGYVINTETKEIEESPVVETHVDVIAAKEALRLLQLQQAEEE